MKKCNGIPAYMYFIGAVIFFALSQTLFAQSIDEVKAREELARQARRNMREIERVLDSLRGTKDQKKIAEEAKKRGKQVVQDIDKLLEFFKVEQGSSKKKKGRQRQASARNRNKREHSSNKPSPGKKSNKGSLAKGKGKGGNPSSPGDDLKGPAANSPRVVEAWGKLPPELRQQLIDRNFKGFTPEYEQAIKDYLRRISNPKKR